jgi:hypothetical protein
MLQESIFPLTWPIFDQVVKGGGICMTTLQTRLKYNEIP